jgi:putative colanic acid biosynthesis UDP-glucose lipid carrier transferase
VLAVPQIPRHFADHQISPAALAQALVDPVATIGALLLCAGAFGVPFEGAYLILALIVFSLTFPGSRPKAAGVRALTGAVARSWGATAALLLLIGWATRTLSFFDPRAAEAAAARVRGRRRAARSGDRRRLQARPRARRAYSRPAAARAEGGGLL